MAAVTSSQAIASPIAGRRGAASVESRVVAGRRRTRKGASWSDGQAGAWATSCVLAAKGR